jgi:hypothetical protein
VNRSGHYDCRSWRQVVVVRWRRARKVQAEGERAANPTRIGHHNEIGRSIRHTESHQRCWRCSRNVASRASAPDSDQTSWRSSPCRHNCGVAAEPRIRNHASGGGRDKLEPNAPGLPALRSSARSASWRRIGNSSGVHRGLRCVLCASVRRRTRINCKIDVVVRGWFGLSDDQRLWLRLSTTGNRSGHSNGVRARIRDASGDVRGWNRSQQLVRADKCCETGASVEVDDRAGSKTASVYGERECGSIRGHDLWRYGSDFDTYTDQVWSGCANGNGSRDIKLRGFVACRGRCKCEGHIAGKSGSRSGWQSKRRRRASRIAVAVRDEWYEMKIGLICTGNREN